MSNTKTSQINAGQKADDQQTTMDYILSHSIDVNTNVALIIDRLDLILSRLDGVANRLNPDAFFKNNPEGEECKEIKGKLMKTGPFLSGTVLRLNETLSTQDDQITRIDNRLDTFSKVVAFFESQI